MPCINMPAFVRPIVVILLNLDIYVVDDFIFWAVDVRQSFRDPLIILVTIEVFV